VPLLSATLTDPFGPSHPDLLLLAAMALQTTILNCWPRMGESFHRLEIVKTLALCWTIINEDASQPNVKLDKVKDELRQSTVILIEAVEGFVDIKAEIAPLLDVDSTLRDLFNIQEADINFRS
jgi:hypothetical protein